MSKLTFALISKFVCDVYAMEGVRADNLKDMRWKLLVFCKKMAERDGLPPTEETLM